MSWNHARTVTFAALGLLVAGADLALAGDPNSKVEQASSPQAVGVAGHVRHLALEGAVNFRDLGGYTEAGGRRVRWGRLYRSDALDSLTTADRMLLGRLNITRITDFRTDSEVAKRPDRLPAELAARLVHVPLDDVPPGDSPQRAEVDAANAGFMRALELTNEELKLATIDRLIVDHYYPRFARDSRPAYRRWLQGLLDGPSDAAQIFHCTGGADRTGFAAALLLLTLGVPKEQILEDYLLTNQYLFSSQGLALFKEKGVTAMPAGYRLEARYLEASFKAMEDDYGSIENYLREALGIDDGLRGRLRARYLESAPVSIPSHNPASLPVSKRFADPRPIIVAHRGCWRTTTENSLASLQSCIRQGIDAAEIDIQTTRDAALVLLHDDDLDRTTNLTGPVVKHTLAELSGVKLREGKGGPGSRLTQERIPTLSQALHLAKGRMTLFLDTKCRGCDQAIEKEVEAAAAQDWVVFIGGPDKDYRKVSGWAKQQTMVWINDCKLQAEFPQIKTCFNSFVEGIRSFGDDRPFLFLPWSREMNFFTTGLDAPEFKGVHSVVTPTVQRHPGITDEEILAQSQRQWNLYLEAASPAIIEDHPQELLEHLRVLGKR